MKKYTYILIAVFLSVQIIHSQDTFTIETNVGTMKGVLFSNVPNHVRNFIQRVQRGDFNGTLFTRVIKEFMIQGGSQDSKNAPAGARIGTGDRSSEIMPEPYPQYFHKKGALAAPRQPDEINPQKKSDMSQFFIVQGKVYRGGELDTLERVANQEIRRKAMAEFYSPVRVELEMMRRQNPREYNKRAAEINAKVDSVIRSTPGHLLFTDEQREAYTTIGGCHHLDGIYTIYGEVTEGFDVIDLIANQPKDAYDRPKKDIRITRISIN